MSSKLVNLDVLEGKDLSGFYKGFLGLDRLFVFKFFIVRGIVGFLLLRS